jgi:hypothetical protein
MKYDDVLHTGADGAAVAGRGVEGGLTSGLEGGLVVKGGGARGQARNDGGRLDVTVDADHELKDDLGLDRWRVRRDRGSDGSFGFRGDDLGVGACGRDADGHRRECGDPPSGSVRGAHINTNAPTGPETPPSGDGPSPDWSETSGYVPSTAGVVRVTVLLWPGMTVGTRTR